MHSVQYALPVLDKTLLEELKNILAIPFDRAFLPYLIASSQGNVKNDIPINELKTKCLHSSTSNKSLRLLKLSISKISQPTEFKVSNKCEHFFKIYKNNFSKNRLSQIVL